MHSIQLCGLALVLMASCDPGEVVDAGSSGTALVMGGSVEATTILSFTFDDALDSHPLAARILEGDDGIDPQDSFRGTFFVVSGALRRATDGPGRMTASDVEELLRAGHEVGGHTLGHASLSSLAVTDPYELRRQICNDRRALDALGARPIGFAYPRSDDQGAHDAVRMCGYGYGRDASELAPPAAKGPHAETIPPLDPWAIRALPSIDAAGPLGSPGREIATAEKLKAWVETVRAAGGGWLVLTLHHVRNGCGSLRYCMEERELRAIVAWLRTRPDGIAVRTMDQVMIGDPLVANPSLEQPNPSSSPTRPLCFRRIGKASNFPSIVAPAAGRSGSYAEALRPTAQVATPAIEIDPAGRGCALPVVVGRRYEVQAFIRSSSAAPSARALARATVSLQIDGGWQPAVSGPVTPADGTWTLLRFTTDPIPPGTTSIVFGIQYAGTSGGAADLQVDDLSVLER
ncbi:MAG: polysaccharide deacetylase family protein [Kofleriaceae bacterium]